MIAIFSDFAKTHAEVSAIDGAGAGTNVEMTVFVRSPTFLSADVVDTGDPNYLDHIVGPGITLSDLKDMIGWQALENGVDNTGDYSVGLSYSTSSGVTDVNIAANLTYSGDPVFATAFVFSVDGGADDDEVLMILQPEEPFFMWGGVTPNVSSLSFANPLFSFLETAEANGSSNPEVGGVSISVPVSGWESARSAHVWMDPQRINLIANPSFEATNGDFYAWRSDATVNHVAGGVGREGRQFCAELAGSDGSKILESLPFPAGFSNEWWSVECFVAGQGSVRIGLLMWDYEMNPDEVYYQTTDWYEIETSTLSGTPEDGAFTQISALIPNLGENIKEAQFRLEFLANVDNNQSVWVDDVIVEPNPARLGYFDGDWTLGQPNDYQWYGGGLTPHSYSIFYNNRTNLQRQLFGWYEADGTKVEGSTDRLVPEGVAVVPHWDDIYSVKSQSWISDVYVPVKEFTATQQGQLVTPVETNSP